MDPNNNNNNPINPTPSSDPVAPTPDPLIGAFGLPASPPPAFPNPQPDLSATVGVPPTVPTTPAPNIEPVAPVVPDPIPVAQVAQAESTWPQPSTPAPDFGLSASPPPWASSPSLADSPPLSQPVLPSMETVPPTVNESVPTDLSHLMDTSAAATSGTVMAQPETLVVPSSNTEASQVVTSSGSKGFPKLVLIIGGLVLLLAVIGASAYFILGIGKESATTSLPAEQQPLSTPPKLIIPTTPPPAPQAEGSFGKLAGQSTPSASPTAAATSSGESALELLRKRNQQ